MATYKVKALSVGGLGNKIFYSGNEVTDKNFPPGNAEDLVKRGFLIEVPANVVTKVETKLIVTNESEEAGSDSLGKKFTNAKGEDKVVRSVDDITKQELVKELTYAKKIFDANSKKEVLFDQWMKL